MKPTGCESCDLAKGIAISKVKLLIYYIKTAKIVRFSPNLPVADTRNKGTPQKQGYRSQSAPMKDHLCCILNSLWKKFLNSCTKDFIIFRENQRSRHNTGEQADNPLLRYVIVISHACIGFVLVVSFKR